MFADGAARYLVECKEKGVRTLDTISYHVLLPPLCGTAPIEQVDNTTFDKFKRDRQQAGSKPSTINRTLEVVRTILNRSARVWRWVPTAPLIEMLEENSSSRKPYPINWDEQDRLVRMCQKHIAEMVIFAVNTGARDENICGLRWSWEVPVPGIKRSVFVIPATEFKSTRPHVLVLNDTAWLVVQARRGKDPEYVFTYKGHGHAGRIDTINNTSFQKARKAAGLEKVRVHDLRHTFGQRLRSAGVTDEDRALLLGHASQEMPQHYATATIARLLEAANSALETDDRETILRIIERAA